MGSSNKNKNVLNNERNAPWLISRYEKLEGIAAGTLRELTPTQMIKVMGLPTPLLTFEFQTLPTLYLTSWHTDITYDNKVFRASADLIKGEKISNTTELHNDGSSYKLSAIRDDILQILEAKEAKNAKVITQAAIMDDFGDLAFVLDVDIGIVDASTLEIDPTRGLKEITFKTNSIYKRLEGVSGTRLAASAQRAHYPNDSSFDYITDEYIQAAIEQAEKDAQIKAAEAEARSKKSWWRR